MNFSILVVEDDKGIRTFLKDLLVEERFSVKTAADGTSARSAIEKYNPDLVILDLMLPDITGDSLCAEIKKDNPDTIVIMLTAKDSTSDVVAGLKKGADDYIKKPFDIEELLARIRVRLNEKGKNEKQVIRIDDLVIDTKGFAVKRADKLINLTPQEFKLLVYLAQNNNQVLTRDMILNRIWQGEADVETRVVDVYIGYLRKKIDKGFKNQLIQSVRGFGYCLKDPLSA